MSGGRSFGGLSCGRLFGDLHCFADFDRRCFDRRWLELTDDANEEEGQATNTSGLSDGIADIFSLTSLDDLAKIPINIDSHCYGCTAGMGSS